MIIYFAVNWSNINYSEQVLLLLRYCYSAVNLQKVNQVKLTLNGFEQKSTSTLQSF